MVMPSSIPKSEIINRLQDENPWWVSGEVDTLYQKMTRRLYFESFYPYVKKGDVRRAVVLMGPKRVGKTIMMFHTIDQLLKEGVAPQNLIFVGIDNPIYINLGLKDILQLVKEALKREDLKDSYVFFEGIQYLKDWQRHLKTLVDSFPEIKFIVSGSAAAALNWYSSESGAGRFTNFMLPPLTFQEYIHLKKLNNLVYEDSIIYNDVKVPQYLARDLKVLNKEFVNYLNYGGYPEVVLSETIQSDMRRYVKSGVANLARTLS